MERLMVSPSPAATIEDGGLPSGWKEDALVHWDRRQGGTTGRCRRKVAALDVVARARGAEMLGVDDYLRKPFAMDRLLDSVERLLST